VLTALEQLDRDLQAHDPVALEGTGSLHASIIAGGRELSSYPDQCTLQLERRIVSGESGDQVEAEIARLLDRLRHEDADLDVALTRLADRPPYRVDVAHPIVSALHAAIAEAGRSAEPTGMTFWTDAAILGHAGIPTVLFGPGGAGLHGLEEYVNVDDVYVCRDVLVSTARRFVERAPR
jgi:acetylornithine deacetylase